MVPVELAQMRRELFEVLLYLFSPFVSSLSLRLLSCCVCGGGSNPQSFSPAQYPEIDLALKDEDGHVFDTPSSAVTTCAHTFALTVSLAAAILA
jgi:hypothetical protein